MITPSLNIANVAICLLGIVLLFTHHEGLRFRLVWAWTMALWGLCDLICVVLDLFFDIPLLTVGEDPLQRWPLVVCDFVGWLLVMYPTEALRPGWINTRRIIYTLLPLVGLILLEIILPIDLTPLIAFYPLFLVVYLSLHVRAYRVWCEQNYSSLENIDAQWIIRYILILISIGGVFFYMRLSVHPTRVFTEQLLLTFLFIYGTNHILFRRNPWANMSIEEIESEIANIEKHVAQSDEAEPDKAQSVLSAKNQAQIDKLEHWMTTSKPYLNPDLKRTDLQMVLTINRNYITSLLHEAYGCTFYQFVNRYRVEEAKHLIQANPTMSMNDVASSCGFSSRRQFYQVFTRETGLPPKEWFDAQTS
ncbi:MAG: helix-turn-helix domain-containing protein [Paludibacteraceae bacterium]|nr:helix-turn-helix domain-containing protein [Paludibacteraceae bacterium]